MGAENDDDFVAATERVWLGDVVAVGEVLRVCDDDSVCDPVLEEDALSVAVSVRNTIKVPPPMLMGSPAPNPFPLLDGHLE